ncbi:MAG: hypothetical protein EPO23_08650 [Xanthobacteraceae bacterium]|nr:MAG: hypothetical protein EPO23_08650 [Xanthobacteraceae bacterium]
MGAKTLCIFCEAELGPDTKPEHIMLNALGGRRTTKRVICSKHNNDFGGGIDNALAKQIEVLRNLLQLESGTGKLPPALKNLQAGSERINIRNDGRPELVKPPFTVTDLPDGKFNVEFLARSSEDIKKMLPHLAARLRMTEEEVIKQITQNGQAAIVEMQPDTVHHHISLGCEEALRSMAKSCLVLLATVTGNGAVKAAPFAAARNYVLNGSPEFNKERTQIDSRDVPSVDDLRNRFGPFFNLIYIRSDDAGRVIGHFTIYNAISWQIVLAEAGGPPNGVAAIVSNPLEPATWEDVASSLPDIPFGWLDAADRVYEIERARERLVAMVKHHVDNARKTETARICDDVFAKHGVTDDDQPIADPNAQQTIVGEIARRLAAHALGLRHEQKLSPEETEAMLRCKKK